VVCNGTIRSHPWTREKNQWCQGMQFGVFENMKASRAFASWVLTPQPFKPVTGNTGVMGSVLGIAAAES
jgi:hypothetical protein